jgi:hypothetical protein
VFSNHHLKTAFEMRKPGSFGKGNGGKNNEATFLLSREIVPERTGMVWPMMVQALYLS